MTKQEITLVYDDKWHEFLINHCINWFEHDILTTFKVDEKIQIGNIK